MANFEGIKSKSPVLAGVLGFLFGGFGLFYLSFAHGVLYLSLHLALMAFLMASGNGLIFFLFWPLAGAVAFFCIKFPEWFGVVYKFDETLGNTSFKKIWRGSLFLVVSLIFWANVGTRLAPPGLAAARDARRQESEALEQYKRDQEGGRRVWEKMQAQEEERRRVQQDEIWRQQVRNR